MIREKCGIEHDGSFGSGRFCCIKCSNSRPCTPEKKAKIRAALSQGCVTRVCANEGCTNTFDTKPSSGKMCCGRKCGAQWRFTNIPYERLVEIGFRSGRALKRKRPSTIFDVSVRTTRKILQRLAIACVNCGWDKTTCDIHHINGHKIPNANRHDNLTYVCPNCHRLIHNKKLDATTLPTFEDIVGEAWRKYYGGCNET